MARNRVIYQSEALYVSKNINSTTSGEHRQLERVQSANYSFNIQRQDVNQFGQLARIDALVLTSPTVSLDFSYYPTDGFNERALGFYVQTGTKSAGNFSSGQMGSSSGQNYYIVTALEGSDLNFETGVGVDPMVKNYNSLSGKTIIGIGNGFLTDYTLDASVGNLPTVKITVEGLNMNSAKYTIVGNSTGVLTPKVNPTAGTADLSRVVLPVPTPYSTGSNGTTGISALRPGDIVLSFGNYGNTGLTGSAVPMSNASGTFTDGLGENGMHIQSASLSLPLRRTPIERLGSRFAFARVVDFPIVAKLDVKAIVNEVESRNLAAMLDDNAERDITIRIKNSTNTNTDALVYTLKGSRLSSESYSSSIGANKSVDLSFETQIGGPNDELHGVFLSGIGAQDTPVASWGY